MADEPDNLVLQLLRQIRADMVTKAELKSELNTLRADIASDLAVMQARTDSQFKRVDEQIVGLRRAVVEYHSAVIGHGILISELEARTRRIEQHLNLPAMHDR